MLEMTPEIRELLGRQGGKFEFFRRPLEEQTEEPDIEGTGSDLSAFGP